MKKYLVIALLIYTTNLKSEELNFSRIANILKINDLNFKIDDVTERESDVRGIPLYTARIAVATDVDLFFPLIVYTAPIGTLNTPSYDELKIEFKNPNFASRADYLGTMGFIFEGEDEAFVCMEEVRIASIYPPRPSEPRPWQASHKMGFSIVGTLASQKMDFQIFVISPSSALAESLPEYKKIFVAPPDFKKFGGELYAAVQEAGLLESKAAPDERPPKSRGVSGDDTAGMPSGKTGTHTAVIGNDKQAPISTGNFWLWILLATAIALPLLVLALRRAKQ